MERRDVAAVSRRSLVVGRGGGSRPFLFNAETIGIRPEPKSESPKDHLWLKCAGRCLPNNLMIARRLALSSGLRCVRVTAEGEGHVPILASYPASNIASMSRAP